MLLHSYPDDAEALQVLHPGLGLRDTAGHHHLLVLLLGFPEDTQRTHRTVRADGDRHPETHTDRHTERHTDRHTETYTDRQSVRTAGACLGFGLWAYRLGGKLFSPCS